MGKKDNRRGRSNPGADTGPKGTAVATDDTDNGKDQPSLGAPVMDLATEKIPEEPKPRFSSSSMDEEKGDVFKMIMDLEGQLESTFAMKDALENDLEVSHKEIGELRWGRKELEARIKVLGAEAATASDLQAELSFAEDERTRALEVSQDLETKLAAVEAERNTFKTKASETQSSLKEAEKAKGDLESQVYRLSEKVRALEEVQGQLVEVRSDRDKAVDRIRDIESELESMKQANHALDLALKHSEEAGKELREDKKRLDKAIVEVQDERRSAKSRTTRLEEEHEGSLARIAVLENEVTAMTGRNHALEAEMDSARMTLGEIHTALADTKAKARKRYYRVKKT